MTIDEALNVITNTPHEYGEYDVAVNRIVDYFLTFFYRDANIEYPNIGEEVLVLLEADDRHRRRYSTSHIVRTPNGNIEWANREHVVKWMYIPEE